MDWVKQLKYLKEESPYLCLAVAIIFLFIFFLPVFSGLLGPSISELLTLRHKYSTYIFAIFIISAAIGLAGVRKRIVDHYKKKNEEIKQKEEQKANLLKQKRKNEALLSQLKELAQIDNKFKTRESSMEWANQVAPLLKFNSKYYGVFMNNAQLLPWNFTSNTLGPAISSMENIVSQAIRELQTSIENLTIDLEE